MYPTVAVVTNLEADHMDCYADLDDLTNAYLSYMNRVPFYGSVIISADDENLRQLRPRISRPYSTFGFTSDADYYAVEVTLDQGRSTFSTYHKEEHLGEVMLRVPGRHNVANALAAIATCRELEVPFTTIADGLLSFSGTSRRFEFIGEANGILVIDDYAHHPTEIAATLRTAKEVYNRRVIVVYQPHLYSRTRDFMNEFARALALADKCLLADVYPAREKPIEGITSEVIIRQAQKMGIGDFRYIGPKENAPEEVANIARPGDMVITMGAGSITLMKKPVLEALQKR
jgi:UDP-N-acetylmuramate--alanine ligase